jgi:hypothetical protein
MERAALQLIFSFGLGLYVIVFARALFNQPERIRQRWYSWLPERLWVYRLLRYLAVFLMWCGFMLLAGGLMVLPFLAANAGTKLLISVAIVAAVLTGLLAANTPRRQWSGR